MKMSKKILALLLATVMLVAMTACGGSKPAEQAPAAPAQSAPSAPAASTPAPAPAATKSDFPTKAVRMIIPYAAGGNSDLCARKLAEIIDKYNLMNGQQLVVTNIQGSATQEAFNALMGADPDGYTLCLQHNAILTQPAWGNVTFTMEDVDAVCQVMEQPFMVFADADAPFNNTAELIDYVKNNPGKKITFGIPGVGASGQVGSEIFFLGTGIRDSLQMVFYPSGGDSLTGHLAGECVMHGGFATDGMRYVESGELKVIAVSGTQRVDALPDVQCFGELGFKENYMTRQGVWATKGTPAEVLDQLAEIFKKATETPEWEQYMKDQACQSSFAGPKEWHDLMAADNEVILDLVARYNLAG